ncbi:MAG TPA: hypothetical protein VJT67_17275, partial [Longimicrobiaceae bacterium]|nr:hypothetical protein [Longimicrobiaceae bacterium]
DSGEIPHVIGDAGLIAPEGDVGRWTAALGELIASPGRRAEFVTRGMERARTEFALPVVAKRHLDFFESLMANNDFTQSRRDAEK